MRPGPAYPPARERAKPAPRYTSDLYGRIESTSGEVTCGDTDATIITFSGTPDLIILSARAFGALVTLTDRLNREVSEVAVQANSQIKVNAKRERVVARNLVAGSAALLTVTGLWAEEDEAGSGEQ